MPKVASYDIVFQELPGEVTLALNISGCPNACPGCHSPHLREDVGEPLNETLIAALLAKYGEAATCICFMGGDAVPKEIDKLAAFIRTTTDRRMRTGWYSGMPKVSECVDLSNFDYIKLGAYIENLGGLASPTTNQRLYRVEKGALTDITDCFRKKSFNQR